MEQSKTIQDTDMFSFERYCNYLMYLAFLALIIGSNSIFAGDQPQWGQKYSRNMLSSETDLPESFDLEAGRNVKWIASLGTKTYATPIVADNKVYICTNNEKPRDPRHKGDRGVLLCLNEKDGSLCWQLIVPKIKEDPYKDWPGVGMVSPATVDDDRVYIVSNRGEVLCLDPDGLSDGNDGPYQNEADHMVPKGSRPISLTDKDADIIWLFDLPDKVGVYPHDSAHCSILSHNDFLYVNTSSGLNSKHDSVRSPQAPCLIVLDKKTGRWLAKENESIGPNIFHAAWSSPCLGEVNGKELIFYAGADGVVYAFEPLASIPKNGEIENLKKIWYLDCDPAAPKENIHQFLGNRKEGPSTIESIPVFYKNRVYVSGGGDIWWGKKNSWLQCIDASLAGNITDNGRIWSYPIDDHCVSTPSIYNGLIFIADCRGRIHCLDAETGEPYWIHQTKKDIWSSTLVADGKVYAGSLGREFSILKADKKKHVLSSITLDSEIIGSPIVANKTLYITTMKKLYAISKNSK